MKKNEAEILAIDIGNTTANGALCSRGRFIKHFRIPTQKIRAQTLKVLRRQIPADKKPVVVIASVVPQAGTFLKKNIPRALKCPAYLIGKDLKVPIKNKYKNPRQVGADRLLNALAAFRKYKRELIVIDFGTAITFDIVSKKGEYLGGVIAPGIEISLDALFSRTALLPKTKLLHTQEAIGRDTAASIRIGCSAGIGGLCDRIVDNIARRMHPKPLVVATGGYARFMSRYCQSIKKIDDDLVLKGIVYAYHAQLSKAAGHL